MATRYEYYTSADRNRSVTFGVHWRGNSFTIKSGESHTLTKIVIWVSRAGLPGTCYVEVFLADGEGKPTGSAISTGSFNGDSLPTDYLDPACIIDVSMTPCALMEGSQYVFQVEAPSGYAGNNLYVEYRIDATYVGGVWTVTEDGGLTWVLYPDDDCYFEEWGDPLLVAPTVTTDPATGIEAVAATGNGNITDNGGENCDKRGFVYNASPHGDPGDIAPADSEYSNYVEETDSFGTGAFTGALTSLEPKTTYYVRAYAHNSEGYSYGNEVSFTTLVAIGKVTTDEATNVKETSATLKGTLDDDGGEACEVRFQYGLTTDYGTNTAWQPGKETGDTFSQLIVELVGGNLYHFRAQAKNSAGTANGNDRALVTITPFVARRAYALSREEL